MKHQNRTIWIDLDNSPHVIFFKPIIEELERKNYKIILTARDCFQVCGMADNYKLNYKKIGRHYGKNKLLKIYGLVYRAMQLTPFVIRNKPRIALSHGSRSQIFTASVLGIPSIAIQDYEYVTEFARPTWGIVPEIIPDDSIRGCFKKGLLKYSGIKEDVYTPHFNSDPSIKEYFGWRGEDLIVTVRPPATEAHYHNPESEILFQATMELLSKVPVTKVIILPRSKNQEKEIDKTWNKEIASGKFIIPDRVIDGLNLIWHSDLVISGGGTMNREAAALGVPVYSIFRGKIGAIDKYLAENARLTLLESVDDVKTKLRIEKRIKQVNSVGQEKTALKQIVTAIENIMK